MKCVAAETHPALDENKIKVLIRVIADAREGARERNDLEFGDDNQTLGMRAYKNVVKTLDSLQQTRGYEWLSVLSPKGVCTILVDGQPLRFWRADDPELEAEPRRLAVAIEAVGQLTLFPIKNQIVDRWAIVYQVDHKALLSSASIVGYFSETCEPIVIKEISIEEIPTSVALFKENLPEPVKVDKGDTKIKLKSFDMKNSTSKKNGRD